MWWRLPWMQQRWLPLGLAVFDAITLVGIYNLWFWISFEHWAGVTVSVSVVVGFWLSGSYLSGRYSMPERGEKNGLLQRLLSTIVLAVIIVTTVASLTWFIKLGDPQTFRGFLIPVLTSVTMISSAAQIRVSQLQQRTRHWLIVGLEHEISVVRAELEACRQLRDMRVQFVDSSNLPCLSLAGMDLLDGLALSESAPLADAFVQELLQRRGRGAEVCTLVNWSEQHLQRVPPELFSSRWLVQAEGFRLQPGRAGWRIKRLGDLVVASAILVLAAPILALAAVAIRLDDGGPILYCQIRTGLYGVPFRLWKLRTMAVGAERQGAEWAKPDDSRITRVGQWLRRTRIDELPQLVSVLKGRMSLIGPRPERPELETALERMIPHYRVRHWVRPGLSGWAQVCFPYGASIADSRAKLCYDIYYLRNANWLLDLLILIKTIKLVTLGQGAVPRPHPGASLV